MLGLNWKSKPPDSGIRKLSNGISGIRQRNYTYQFMIGIHKAGKSCLSLSHNYKFDLS